MGMARPCVYTVYMNSHMAVHSPQTLVTVHTRLWPLPPLSVSLFHCALTLVNWAAPRRRRLTTTAYRYLLSNANPRKDGGRTKRVTAKAQACPSTDLTGN